MSSCASHVDNFSASAQKDVNHERHPDLGRDGRLRREGTKVGQVVRYNKNLGYFETMGTFPDRASSPSGPWSGLAHRVHIQRDEVDRLRQLQSHAGRHAGAHARGKLTGGGRVQSGRTGEMVPRRRRSQAGEGTDPCRDAGPDVESKTSARSKRMTVTRDTCASRRMATVKDIFCS